jgi:hypothetical protein
MRRLFFFAVIPSAGVMAFCGSFFEKSQNPMQNDFYTYYRGDSHAARKSADYRQQWRHRPDSFAGSGG